MSGAQHTPDDARWLSGRLWAELRGIPGRPGIPSWDVPLNPKLRRVQNQRADGSFRMLPTRQRRSA